MQDEQRISPSQMGRWNQCEKRALAEEQGKGTPDPSTHIAAHVGTCAHALLADQPKPPMPDLVTWDSVTQSEYGADLQAQYIAKEARRALERFGWKPVQHEVEVAESYDGLRIKGTLDLLCVRQYGQTDMCIFDLKTGAVPAGVWLQLGAYARALMDSGVLDEHAFHWIQGESKLYVGVLHVPRTHLSGETHAKAYIREAAWTMFHAKRQARRIESLIEERFEPFPTPGAHCATCPVTEDCAVSTYAEEVS